MDMRLVESSPYGQGTAVMHWNATNRKDHEALWRLAVVLLKLASIAESIALRSRPVCAIVLWLLCRAEVRVRDLAFKMGAGAAFAFPSAASPLCWLGGGGEAARLAERFRALAAGFFAISRRARLGLWTAGRYGCVSLLANCRTRIGPGQCFGLRHRSCIDTS
jgi:hypothetical protein